MLRTEPTSEKGLGHVCHLLLEHPFTPAHCRKEKSLEIKNGEKATQYHPHHQNCKQFQLSPNRDYSLHLCCAALSSSSVSVCFSTGLGAALGAADPHSGQSMPGQVSMCPFWSTWHHLCAAQEPLGGTASLCENGQGPAAHDITQHHNRIWAKREGQHHYPNASSSTFYILFLFS